MSRLSVFLIALIVSCSLLVGQGTTIIQTPFGPKEIPATETQQPPQQSPPSPAPAPIAQPTLPNPPQNPGNTAAQPAPQAPANAQQADNSPVELHIFNQDIRQVIQIIGNALQLNYIIDPMVRGTVDINTSDTLRRSDLLPILESILKINGATMIRTGNFYQIVPANTAAKQPIEVIDQQARVAPDDQIVMQIIRMKFVAASEMSRILTPYLSDAGTVVVHETGNIMLLTDRRSNIRKLLEIVDIFDTASFQGERIRLLPVKNNRARDVVDDLKTIFTGYALSDKQSAIRFIVIERLNAILVVTPNPDVFPEVERWLGVLDQPVVLAGIRNYVYKVKNSKAVDLQRVLVDLYDVGFQGSLPVTATPSYTGVQQQGTALGQPQTPAGQSGQSGQPTQQAQSGQPFQTPAGSPANLPSGNQSAIRIIADELNNALVIKATPQQYAEIEKTLEQLDVLRRQVLIDAQIYEVVLDDSLQFGVTAALQNRSASNQTTAAFSAPSGGLSSLSLNTFALIGRTRELQLFLSATENRSRVRTLSAPSVLVTDNGVAQVQVGTEVPVPTSSSVTPVQSGGTNLFAQTIQFRNTGVILQVKPQVNESGNVTLDIAQEVSQAGANTISAIVAPVIGKSSVTSQVVVEDGQTIAIGGFIRENNELARNRIPLVGRVPVLGAVLGNTRNASNRTELIVLITPHVLRTHIDADLATDELKSKLKEIKRLLK
jgi:general secretion pathway protein D